MHKVHRNVVVVLLLACWVAGLVWALTWYESHYIKPFERPALFDGVSVEPPFDAAAVQVLHVWQAGCPCNGGHQAYVNDMTERFAEQGVLFARSGQRDLDALPQALRQLPYWPMPAAWSAWPGAPAVAIWGADGRLAYVGPYSDGASCSEDSSFVEPVIRALLAGRQVDITRQDTVSCLCDIEQSESGE